MKKVLSLILVVFLGVVIYGCGGSKNNGGSLTTAVGFVKDAATNSGINDATVTIGSQSVTTNSNGSFQLNGIPTGQQIIKVTAVGYVVFERQVAVNKGSNDLGTILLTLSTADIKNTSKTTGSDGQAEFLVNSNTSIQVQLKDTSGNYIEGVEIAFLTDGDNTLFIAADPNNNFIPIIFSADQEITKARSEQKELGVDTVVSIVKTLVKIVQSPSGVQGVTLSSVEHAEGGSLRLLATMPGSSLANTQPLTLEEAANLLKKESTEKGITTLIAKGVGCVTGAIAGGATTSWTIAGIPIGIAGGCLGGTQLAGVVMSIANTNAGFADVAAYEYYTFLKDEFYPDLGNDQYYVLVDVPLYGLFSSAIPIFGGGSYRVIIPLGPPTSIEVSPSAVTLLPSETQFFTATVTFQGLDQRSDIPVLWSSSDTPVGTIDSSGLFTAVAPGQTDVTATKDGVTSNSVSITVSSIPQGTLEGYVKDAVTGNPLEGASIKIYDYNNDLIAEATTDSNGVYTKQLVLDTYWLKISKLGYIAENVYNVVIESNVTTKTIETVLQVSDQYSGKGTIAGTVKSAVSGAGIANASIKFRKGINVTSGTVVSTATTDSSGAYTVSDLDAGNYTGEVSATGYTTAYFTAVSIGGQTKSGQDVTVTPVISSGQTRIVLTWGITPNDLDSHLTGPCPPDEGTSYCVNGRFHLYFPLADANNGSSWPSYVRLDLDDTTSYGPETTTIYQQADGLYRFSVHDFSNFSGSSSYELSNSGAQVKVYRGDTLITSFNVPVNQGGTLWTVFEMNGSTITPINTITAAIDADSVQRLRHSDAYLLRNLPKK